MTAKKLKNGSTTIAGRCPMNDEVFGRFQEVIYQTAGIALSESKRALLCARIGKRMKVLGIQDYSAYLDRVERDTSGRELTELLDAVSTNVTDFFREKDHFEFLSEVLGNLGTHSDGEIRMWSAACATGEEPYTMAITALESLESSNVKVRILATDISTAALRVAQRGEYREDKLSKVPPRMRQRYFRKVGGSDGVHYRVSARVKDMVVFRQLNLSRPPFPLKGPFHIVFCRNVMIYFDNRVRKRLLDEIARVVDPEGYFVVGHAESVAALLGNWSTVRSSIYARKATNGR